LKAAIDRQRNRFHAAHSSLETLATQVKDAKTSIQQARLAILQLGDRWVQAGAERDSLKAGVNALQDELETSIRRIALNQKHGASPTPSMPLSNSTILTPSHGKVTARPPGGSGGRSEAFFYESTGDNSPKSEVPARSETRGRLAPRLSLHRL